MSVDNHVTISITQNTVAVQKEGFGIPLIMSHGVPAGFVERYRVYTNTNGMITDGFLADSAEVLAATAMFSAEEAPDKIAVGRMDLDPTLVYELTPTVLNSQTYSVKVQAPGVPEEQLDFTSDASATATEIVDGLLALVNGVVGKNFTATNVADVLTITGDAAGNWFSVEVLDVTKLSSEMTHADPGVATDLAAIALENNDFYGVYSLYNSAGYITATATWTEAQRKVYLPNSSDTDIIALAAGNSDIADTLNTAARDRTGLMFHPSEAKMAGAALLGRWLASEPGELTTKFKTLPGVPVYTLTATQRANVIAKKANLYERAGGVNITAEGTMASGEFMDTIRDLDWVEVDMSARVFAVLAAAKKIPFTDKGIRLVTKEVKGTLTEAVTRGIFAAGFSVTAPKASEVSAQDKANRTLPDINWSATQAGAIHTVDVTGVVSV